MLNIALIAMLAAAPAIMGDILPDPGTLMVADRRIDIPNLPPRTVAYNPSMTRHRGALYMIFRLDRYDMGWATQMQLGVVQLDKNFKVMRGPTILDTRDEVWANHTSEDPRLISHNNRLYVVFNATHDGSMNSRRALRLAQIKVPSVLDPEDPFEVQHISELILNEPGFRPWQEKNWSPFSYNNSLHFIYRTNPPRVYSVTPDALSAMPKELYLDKVSEVADLAPFAWGDMRGGTPAQYDSNIGKYTSFFHTQTRKDYGGGFKIHYFIGYYAFDTAPPFAISHLLPEPIIVPRMSNPRQPYLEVAYPGGFIEDDNVVHLCYGKNDSSIRVLTLDKWQLYDRLEAVNVVEDGQTVQFR